MINIGLINTNREPYPLPKGLINGGLWITGNIANLLSNDKNYRVCFFTAKDSSLPRRINKISLGIESIYLQMGKRDIAPSELATAIFFEQQLLLEAVRFSKTKKIDILHIHNNFLTAANFLPFFSCPIIYTLHDPVNPAHELFFKKNTNKNLHIVAISEYQKKQAEKSGIPVAATVYNGIDLENFTFESIGGDTLLFSGRMVVKKGVEEAVRIAKLTKKKLIFAGSVREYDRDYLQESVFNKIDNILISWIKVNLREKLIPYYGHSKATIAPILWEEPFGLVAIESMAAGTPVIGYARGAFPEIIKDGQTGFLVNPSDNDIRGKFIIKKTGLSGLREAIERIYSMPGDGYKKMRKNCRKDVEKNFRIEKMVDSYKSLYNKIVL